MFYDYLTLIGHAALMTLGLAICSLIVGLLLSIISVSYTHLPTELFPHTLLVRCILREFEILSIEDLKKKFKC